MVQAQSITPTRTTIQLYEQPPGFVLGAEKRVYTSYFNTLRTRYIGVEVALDYPAAAAGFELTVGCQITRPAGRHLQGELRRQQVPGGGLLPDEPWAVSPVGHGVPAQGGEVLSDGTQGEYPCRTGLPGPLLLIGSHPHRDRAHLPPSGATRSGSVPIDCYVLPAIARILGVMHLDYEFEASATSGSVALGLGWDQPGQWSKGEYLAICQIHGRPFAVERFSVW